MHIRHHFERGITIALSWLALSLSGCMPVVEYAPDSSGGYHRSFRLSTEDAEWKRTVESRIQAEIAGKPPDIHGETWPQLWRNWYASLRHNPDGEERIAYIRAQRKAHGLNPY